MSNKAKTQKAHADEPKKPVSLAMWIIGGGFKLLIAIALLVGSIWLGSYWMSHKPKAKRRPPKPQATLVEVTVVTPQSQQVVVHAMGTVTPARQINLAARVGGQVVSVSPKFIPGGQFLAKESILKIDPKDYELAVHQRASELATAECKLKEELGQQAVAKREYELLGQAVREQDKELLLRKPQLAMAQAAVAAAKASLDKAKLDLARTSITAPFNAMIQNRNVELGSQVSIGTPLASLVDTDEYWVQVAIPVDQLQWLNIPGLSDKPGSTAKIMQPSAWGKGVVRTGQICRLMTDLETQGRMAQLLVSVKDPLDLKTSPAKRHPLIIGSYVRLEIAGREIPNVIAVPRSALHDGHSVWVMTPQKTLSIRRVKIIWSGNSHVYITNGLTKGETLITSNLTAPVEGMALRTPNPGDPEDAAATAPASAPSGEAR